MALISNIETLRKYVKMSYTSTAAQSLPSFDLPEWKYLLPILGRTLYDELSANQTDEAYAILLDYSRAVITPMAVYHDMPFVQAMITETGLKTMSSETMQAAHRWEYEQVREGLLEKAGFAAERLIEYLIANKTGLEWSNEALENCIFKNGKDFGAEYPIYQPYRTFIQMLPIVKEVEDHYISATIGEDFYKSLRTATADTQLKKNLISCLRRAVANLSIAKAIETTTVKITPQGFMMKMASDADDPYKDEVTATRQPLEMKRASAMESGKRYLTQAKDLLDTNASTELFADYFNGPFYDMPLTETEQANLLDDNATRNGVFAL